MGTSGTLTGTRVYAPSADRREPGEMAVRDSPNFGVCLRALLVRMGDTGRKHPITRSSVVGLVKCTYAERNATNRDQSHSNTSRSLVAQHQGS